MRMPEEVDEVFFENLAGGKAFLPAHNFYGVIGFNYSSAGGIERA